MTNLEYNEFEIINFANAIGTVREFEIINYASDIGTVRLKYKKQNLDAGIKLPDVEGYAEFADDKTYTVFWTSARGNWAAGALANGWYSANVNTAGFWSIVRDNTKLIQGQVAGDPTQILLTLQKETLGSVTTNIKAGGKIHGVYCFKSDPRSVPCLVSDVLEFKWAAERFDPDNGGNKDNSRNVDDGNNDENSDSALSMVAYGASFLAAISALAF